MSANLDNHRRVAVKTNMGAAMGVVSAALALNGGSHPVPTIILALVLAYGVDHYGEEFLEWPKEKLQAWVREVGEKLSIQCCEIMIAAEAQGMNASPRATQAPKMDGVDPQAAKFLGKVIEGV